MKYIKQFTIIISFTILGEIIAHLLSPFFNLPASIIGMICLFLSLHYNLLPISSVKETGDFLTNNMAILFIPGGVAIIDQFDIIKDSWFQLLIMIIISTLIVLTLVGIILQKILTKKNHEMGRE